MKLVRKGFLLQADLLAAAKRAAGPGTSDTDTVRLALAKLAGVDPEPYRVPIGRPPQQQEARTA